MAGRVDTTRPAHAGRLGYLPGLDGLRAIAILTVLAFHVGAFAKQTTLRGGFLGVQIFFVISGFLITALLVEEWDRNGRISLRFFYARRALRLFPALFAAIGVAVVYASFAPGAQFDPTAKEALASVFYWDNWFHALNVGDPTILLHTWSLSIEEQFYVVWPIVLVLTLGLAAVRSRLWLLPLAAAVASALGRAIVDLSASHVNNRLYFGTDTRADALLIGCMLALLWARGLPRGAGRLLAWLALPAAAGLAVLMWFEEVPDRSLYVIGLFGCSLASGIVIANVVTGRPPIVGRTLSHPLLVFVGKISYGLYLWHYIAFWIVRDHTAGWSQWARVPLELGLAFAVAVASYYLLELPIVRKKARFTPQRG
jgi:peptidoglycan/LPS O-acetylase OafA/YrhL